MYISENQRPVSQRDSNEKLHGKENYTSNVFLKNQIEQGYKRIT